MHNSYCLKFLSFVFSLIYTEPLALPEPTGKIEHQEIKESSGLAHSLKVPQRYWTHNDSGGKAVLYAMDAKGNHLGGPVRLVGAENQDWEAICVDTKGRMWIGDVGNNRNKRKDLTIYQVEEPGAEIPEALNVLRTIRFRYPDQKAYPPEKLNFDCEAVFVFQDQLYLLTKHRSDTDSKLYRIEDLNSESVQVATWIGRYSEIGQVTDVALHADGKRLAVLTFSGIWIFERPEGTDNFLAGFGKKFVFKNWALRQIEGIAWMDEETLLVSNEQRDLYQFEIDTEYWVDFTHTSAESADESP